MNGRGDDALRGFEFFAASFGTSLLVLGGFMAGFLLSAVWLLTRRVERPD